MKGKNHSREYIFSIKRLLMFRDQFGCNEFNLEPKRDAAPYLVEAYEKQGLLKLLGYIKKVDDLQVVGTINHYIVRPYLEEVEGELSSILTSLKIMTSADLFVRKSLYEKRVRILKDIAEQVKHGVRELPITEEILEASLHDILFTSVRVLITDELVECWSVFLEQYVTSFRGGELVDNMSVAKSMDWYERAFMIFLHQYKLEENPSSIILHEISFHESDFHFLPALLMFESQGLVEILDCGFMSMKEKNKHNPSVQVQPGYPVSWFFVRVKLLFEFPQKDFFSQEHENTSNVEQIDVSPSDDIVLIGDITLDRKQRSIRIQEKVINVDKDSDSKLKNAYLVLEIIAKHGNVGLDDRKQFIKEHYAICSKLKKNVRKSKDKDKFCTEVLSQTRAFLRTLGSQYTISFHPEPIKIVEVQTR